MKKLGDTLGSAILVGGAIAAFCGTIYGAYWLTKTVSYSFFYEDMVTRSIYQEVKPSCLKENSND